MEFKLWKDWISENTLIIIYTVWSGLSLIRCSYFLPFKTRWWSVITENYFISKLIVSLDNVCTTWTGSIYSACFIEENENSRLFCHTMSRKIQFASDNALCIQTSINNKKLSIPLCFRHCIESLMKVYYRETIGESGIKYEHGFSIFFFWVWKCNKNE